MFFYITSVPKKRPFRKRLKNPKICKITKRTHMYVKGLHVEYQIEYEMHMQH